MVAGSSRRSRGRELTRRDFIKVSSAGLGSLLVISGCGGGGGSSNSDTVTLGAALSLSGELAKEGKLARDGYNFFKDWVNSHGGIKAEGKERKVAIKIYDDQSDPNQSAQLYQKLITQDGAQYLLGPYGSSATLQSAVINEKNKLPMVEANGGSTDIFNEGYKYIFGVLSPGPKYLHSVIDVIVSQACAKDHGHNHGQRLLLVGGWRRRHRPRQVQGYRGGGERADTGEFYRCFGGT